MNWLFVKSPRPSLRPAAASGLGTNLVLPMPALFSARAFARVRCSRSIDTLNVPSKLAALWAALAHAPKHGVNPVACGLDAAIAIRDFDADGRRTLGGGAGQILRHP